MSMILGDIKINRFFEGTSNPMMWITKDQKVPEWCTLDIFVGYVVDFSYQSICQLIDCGLYISFLSGRIDGNLKTLDFKGRYGTQLISHSNHPTNFAYLYRTALFPMSFPAEVSTELVFQERGITKTVNHSTKLGRAYMNDSLRAMDNLGVNEFKNVEAKT